MAETPESQGPTRSHSVSSPMQDFVLTPNIKLREKLGAGGMGEVWKADHYGHQTSVAVKFLDKRLRSSSRHIERFRSVLSVVSGFQHPHVCPLFESGEHKELGPWIAMKLIQGHNLEIYRQTRLGTHGYMPISEVIEILEQAASALDYFHSPQSFHPENTGAIHCDIKPSNIGITIHPETRRPCVQLLDFGLAISIPDTERWLAGQEVYGTREYMAPEQQHGQRPVPNTDQYALAVVAYELLANSKPYAGSRQPDTRISMIRGLHQVHDVFRKALAWKPEDRFANCQEFVEALKEKLVDVQDIQLNAGSRVTGIEFSSIMPSVRGASETVPSARRGTDKQQKPLDQRFTEKTELLQQAEAELVEIENDLAASQKSIRIGVIGTRGAGKSTLFASWYLFRGDRRFDLDLIAAGETLEYLRNVADQLRKHGTTDATPMAEPNRLSFRISCEGRQWEVETIDFSGELLNPRGREDRILATSTHEFLRSCDVVMLLYDPSETEISLLDSIDSLFQSRIEEVVLLMTKFDRLGYETGSGRPFKEWFLEFMSNHPVLSSLFNKVKQSYSRSRLTVVPVSATGGNLIPEPGNVLELAQFEPFQIFVPLMLGFRRRKTRIDEIETRRKNVQKRLDSLRPAVQQISQRIQKRTARIERYRTFLVKTDELLQQKLLMSPVPVKSLGVMLERIEKVRETLNGLKQKDLVKQADDLIRQIRRALKNTEPTDIRAQLQQLKGQIEHPELLIFVQQAGKIREDLDILLQRCEKARLREQATEVRLLQARVGSRLAKVALSCFGVIFGALCGFMLIAKLISLLS
ncbi:MAG: protein kinase [Planctomycetaceae bacterium]|nr:protein kinase [Planctomycetaceae bacterium]